MRHGDKINNLGRTAAHRKAMLANMAISLIEHKRITTTLAKAKALRRYVEPLLTKAKDNTTHSRRIIFGYLQNKEALKELFGTVAPKIGDRPGGYVRVIKLGFRRGDGGETAMIELVDFNEVYNPNAGKVKVSKKTRRGGAKKPGETDSGAAVSTAPATVAVDEVEIEEPEMPVAVEEEVMAPAFEEEEPVIEQEAATEMEVVDVAPAEDEVADVAEETAADETVVDETPAEDDKKEDEAV